MQDLEVKTCDPRVEELGKLAVITDDKAARERALSVLLSRTELDVAPYAYAVLHDKISRLREAPPVYGTDTTASESTFDNDLRFNNMRDQIGLIEIQVERRLRSDLVAAGVNDVTGDWSSVYECKRSLDENATRTELWHLSTASGQARRAWEAAGFPNEGYEAENAKSADGVAAAWLETRIRGGRLFSETGITNRELFTVFLLVQHSGNPGLMRTGVSALSKQVLQRRLQRSAYPLMIDSILVLSGDAQRYGTQIFPTASDRQKSSQPASAVNEDRALFYLPAL